MNKKTKERWQNLVMYISASLEQEQDAKTRQEAQEINDEMYRWINENFSITLKRRKPTIFDFKKHKVENQN